MATDGGELVGAKAAAPAPPAELPPPPVTADDLSFHESSGGPSLPADGDAGLSGVALYEGAWARLGEASGVLGEWRSGTLQQMRPWREFCDRSQLHVPARSGALQRSRTNLRYYRSNYIMITIIIAAVAALTNLIFVLSMAAAAGTLAYYRRVTADGGSFILRGHQVTPIQFYVALAMSSLLIFFMSNGSSTLFWLAAMTLGTVGGHSVARQPPDAMQLSALTIEQNDELGEFHSAFGSQV